jgi:hypothetical protein
MGGKTMILHKIVMLEKEMSCALARIPIRRVLSKNAFPIPQLQYYAAAQRGM